MIKNILNFFFLGIILIFIIIMFKQTQKISENLEEIYSFNDEIKVKNSIKVNDVEAYPVTLDIKNIKLVNDIENDLDYSQLSNENLQFLSEIPLLHSTENKFCYYNLKQNNWDENPLTCYTRDDFYALNNFWMEGSIVMFSGDINSIPNGWVLCDGTKGTPDLRGKFIRGATYDTLNDTGGTESETITQETYPKHTHLHPIYQTITQDGGYRMGELTEKVYNKKFYKDPLCSSTDHECWMGNGSFCGKDLGDAIWNAWARGWSVGSKRNHGFLVDVDENAYNFTKKQKGPEVAESHENRPSYYALFFIMRLKSENFKNQKDTYKVNENISNKITTQKPVKHNLISNNDPCTKYKKCKLCLLHKFDNNDDFCVWENEKCVKKNILEDGCDENLDTSNLYNNQEKEIIKKIQKMDNTCNLYDSTKSTNTRLMGNVIREKYFLQTPKNINELIERQTITEENYICGL